MHISEQGEGSKSTHKIPNRVKVELASTPTPTRLLCLYLPVKENARL